jgi:spermidine synthase
MKTLLEIAKPLQTDKFSNHSYSEVYESLFGPRRYQPVCLLEIGVGTGDCLKMWTEYFPEGEVWGCDIDRKSLGGRFRQLDSIDKAAVETAFGAVQFDIILDDGNHDLRYQLGTYENFRSHLASGGIYVVEDVAGPMTAMEQFRQIEPKRSVTAIDLRAMKDRWDDALIVIEDKPCTS